MQIFRTILVLLFLSLPSYAASTAHCTECDKLTSLCVCLIPEYVGIFHWDYDMAHFDVSFDVNGSSHHYDSERALHKDVLDSFDIDLLKDAKVSNLHYELKTINTVQTDNCVIDLAKPNAGMYLVSITKQLISGRYVYHCDIQFAS